MGFVIHAPRSKSDTVSNAEWLHTGEKEIIYATIRPMDNSSQPGTTVVSQALLLVITRSGPNPATAGDEHDVNMGSEAYTGSLYQKNARCRSIH